MKASFAPLSEVAGTVGEGEEALAMVGATVEVPKVAFPVGEEVGALAVRLAFYELTSVAIPVLEIEKAVLFDGFGLVGLV